jgi:uncharacterized membrane protein
MAAGARKGCSVQVRSMLAVLPWLATGLAAEGGSLEGIGVPDGDVSSLAVGISADGSTVIGFSLDDEGNTSAVRWRAETGIVTISPDGVPALPKAVSADGGVVVGSVGLLSGGACGSSCPAFRWTPQPSWQTIEPLLGYEGASASDLSLNGDVLFVELLREDGIDIQTWSQGGFAPFVTDLAAPRISGNGKTLATTTPDGGVRAIGLASGMTIDLAPLPGSTSAAALDVDGDGDVIVGFSTFPDATSRAVRWTTGPVDGRDLGLLAGDVSAQAQGVSVDGRRVVGTSVRGDLSTRGFVWESGTLQDLESFAIGSGVALDGWRLHGAVGISADGRVIAGYGMSPGGRNEGWVMRLPEPSREPAHLAALAALLAAAWRRAARRSERAGP